MVGVGKGTRLNRSSLIAAEILIQVQVITYYKLHIHTLVAAPIFVDKSNFYFRGPRMSRVCLLLLGLALALLLPAEVSALPSPQLVEASRPAPDQTVGGINGGGSITAGGNEGKCPRYIDNKSIRHVTIVTATTSNSIPRPRVCLWIKSEQKCRHRFTRKECV